MGLLLLHIPLCLLSPSSRTSTHVWDGVLDAAALTELRSDRILAGHDGTYSLDRSVGPRTITESIICSLLDQIGDDAPFVEYWSRGHWASMDMHRDIDEALAELIPDPNDSSVGVQRCPMKAHVLYVDVQQASPTCVFHEAGEDGQDDDDDLSTSRGGGPRRMERLTIVPAVAGRLLRFGGHKYHSVPNPVLEYLLEVPRPHAASTDSFASTEGSPTEGPTEGSPTEGPTEGSPTGGPTEGQPTVTRMVILFNTWTTPPMPFGGGLYEQDVSRASVSAYRAVEAKPPRCNPSDVWRTAEHFHHPDDHGDARPTLLVSLMGNVAARRGCEAEQVELATRSPIAEVSHALLSEETVHVVSVSSDLPSK